MNPKTRLHFSLQSLTESSNLATHFDPTNQPPIIIEKMEAVQTVGFSKTPRENFQAVSPEVLALAVKLARMNVRTARASFSGTTSSSMTNNHVDVPHYIRPFPSPPPAEVAKTKPGMQASNGSESQGKVKMKSLAIKGIRAPKKAADDITHLKVKLQEQLVRLNMTDRSKAVGGASRGGGVSCMGEGLGVPGGGGISSRVRRGEDRENEERCQRWRKEQRSRNSRMIYDLSQQVKDLERKTYQKQWHYKGTSRQTQSEVVKKLAAAQRAALRTLQSFSGQACGSPDSIPPELSLLVQQLALVSTFLGQGGGSSEISASIYQLMETMKERQRITKLAQEEEAKSHSVQHSRINSSTGNRLNTKAKCRTKKKRFAQPNSALHPGLLLSPQLQRRRSKARQKTKNMHFTQGTFNSARRQQPPALYTSPCSRPAKDVCSAPANQDMPRPCQLVLACSPTPSGTHKDEKKETSRRGWAQKKAKSPLDPASLKKEQLWYEEVTVSYQDEKKVEEDDKTVDSPVKPLVASDRLSSAIAEQANQLKLLRQDISQKLSELRVGMSNTAPVTLKRFPHLPDSTVSSMAQRLDELVAEEDVIRQRWTSIAYEDPLHINPGPVFNKWKQKPPADKPMVLPHLSTQSKIELENYRQCYAHYLTCTGQSAKEGSSPCEMVERIADELLFEVVECVAEEVGQLCDGYIEGVYGDEFLRPP